MLRAFVMLLGSLFLSTTAGFAQNWFYKGEESAFEGGDGSQMVIGTGGQYAFGLRCDPSGPIILFITPEVISDENVKALNILGTKMLIRIDQLPAIEIETQLNSTDGKLVAVSDITSTQIGQIKDAKSRVAVVLKLNDEMFHEAKIPARGSTAAVGKFIENCKSIQN